MLATPGKGSAEQLLDTGVPSGKLQETMTYAPGEKQKVHSFEPALAVWRHMWRSHACMANLCCTPVEVTGMGWQVIYMFCKSQNNPPGQQLKLVLTPTTTTRYNVATTC